jgi:hypothetical protein
LAALGVTAVAAPADATGLTLYVAAGGADSGTCAAETSPCATITYALTQASPGATIYVSGTIDDHVTISTNVTIAQLNGAAAAVVDGTSTGIVFTVNSSANVTLSELLIEQGGSEGVRMNSSGTLTIDESTITENGSSSTSYGGGISNWGGNLVLDSSTVSQNTAGAYGGGIADVVGGGSVIINNSTISSNHASTYGGGIAEVDSISPGTMSVDDSTISGNSSGAYGGGVANVGVNASVLTINNSTLSGNTASHAGGGIASLTSGITDVTSSTLSGNTAATGMGGGLDTDSATSLAGDIFATASGAPTGGECDGLVTDSGYNVDDDGTCGLSPTTHSVSHSTTIDGFLGTLAANGGPTETVALSGGASNPAQAVIPATFVAPGQTTAACSQADQRGAIRLAPCDMGAYGLTVTTAPSAPGALSATATTGAIDLSWSAPTSTGGIPLTDYEIFRGTATGAESGAALATVTGTTYVDTAITAGITYYYVVEAINSIGASLASSEARATLPAAVTASPPTGYWLVGGDGGVFTFGPSFYGSTGNLHLNEPVVAMASSGDGHGYWFVARDGGVFAYGDAAFEGSVPGVGVRVTDIVGIAADPATGGYWLVGSDGGVYSFDAPFHGSLPGTKTVTDIVGIAATADGGGYDLVGADGSVYTFGDAVNHGQASSIGHLNAPVVGIATDDATGGYWEVGSDGGVYAYDAPFHGSTGSIHLDQPIVGISAASAGTGYDLVGADGGVFAFGTTYFGSMGGKLLNAPVVGIAAPE